MSPSSAISCAICPNTCCFNTLDVTLHRDFRIHSTIKRLVDQRVPTASDHLEELKILYVKPPTVHADRPDNILRPRHPQRVHTLARIFNHMPHHSRSPHTSFLDANISFVDAEDVADPRAFDPSRSSPSSLVNSSSSTVCSLEDPRPTSASTARRPDRRHRFRVRFRFVSSSSRRRRRRRSPPPPPSLASRLRHPSLHPASA